MGTLGRTLHYAVALIVMLGAGALVPAVSQQQTPATKVTTLLKEVVAELPGREIIMVTLDIPPVAARQRIATPGITFSATCWRGRTSSSSIRVPKPS
jgi:hypothetical protein